MRIRSASLALGTAAALAVCLFSAPISSAAELTINGDTCTIKFSEDDLKTVARSMEAYGKIIQAELKKAMPSVAEDIDAAIAGEADEEASNRITEARIKAGFTEEEFFALSFAMAYSSWVASDPSSAEILNDTTISKTEAAKHLGSEATSGTDTEGWSDKGKEIMRKAESAFKDMTDLENTLAKACIEDRPGTYDLRISGGGGNTGDQGSASGSSSFSFGSS
ncbi:hypothetical protein CGLAR1_06285 [Corynebacterium glutamicum]|uniref:hypothetical protein n=1 Tax=Corynebacterium glutamicum TaxID=1718 RepID=UPI0004F5A18F|nr:hypothetical protein [Corynebacterium glutamicum]AIK84870.1 hypothetical protein CGLAR1_06285 [Corynebacterium glutamicum]AIK87654.1 hypothetical protein AR0_06420 [Corynebacterium glutamicum]